MRVGGREGEEGGGRLCVLCHAIFVYTHTHTHTHTHRASEGMTVQVDYRGDVTATVQDILGGLRSTCTYVGAQKLKELSRRTTFIRVTQQSSAVFQS